MVDIGRLRKKVPRKRSRKDKIVVVVEEKNKKKKNYCNIMGSLQRPLQQ